MSPINFQKLQTRILAGYGIPLMILLILGGTSWGAMSYRNGVSKDIKISNDTIQLLDQVMLGSGKIVRSIRGQIIFPTDSYYQQNFDKGVKIYQDAFDQVRPIVSEDHRGAWEELERQVKTVETQGEEVLKLAQAGKIGEAKEKVKKVRVSKFEEAYLDLLEKEKAEIEGHQKEEQFASNLTVVITIGGVLVAFGLTGVAGVMISGSIAEQLRKSANTISASSSEIAATMEQQERTANHQAASVNETSTTMDELGASSLQSEEQAQAASQSAQEVLALARRGNLAVEATVTTMVELKNKVAAIAAQTIHLSEQTSLIGNISKLVSDLAEQTNMLALNASVEAVRAGEQGKGFAVVAQEIRKLADQSQYSAQKINNLVSDIQNAINTTVMVTDEGHKMVNEGMNITEQTAQAFAGVVEAVNNVATNSQQIALNIKQQSRAVQQVLTAMDAINQGAQQTATGITQIKTGTKQLNETAKNLEAVI